MLFYEHPPFWALLVFVHCIQQIFTVLDWEHIIKLGHKNKNTPPAGFIPQAACGQLSKGLYSVTVFR